MATTIQDADITDVVTRLRAGKEQVTTTLHELEAAVRDLVSAGFSTDTASEAFATAYGELTQGTIQAAEGVEGMAVFLEKVLQTYGTTDTDLASQIRG